MAKFYPSFSLCPIIDQKCSLGISNDKEPNCVIVTLGKNAVLRFRLSDQKQISCWSLKDKISSAVVYDAKLDLFIGVFNEDMLSCWPCNANVDLKKTGVRKLPHAVHNVVSYSGCNPIIIFKNGTIASLDSSSDGQSSITFVDNGPLGSNITILDSHLVTICDNIYIVIFASLEGDTSLHFLPLTNGDKFIVSFKNPKAKLSSYCILDKRGTLVSVWSDGSMFTNDLSTSVSGRSGSKGRKFIAKFVSVDCSEETKVIDAGDNHIALLGQDGKGEGAFLCLIDVAYGTLRASVKLKLFSKPVLLYRVSNDYLITTVGLSLTVLPYKCRGLALAAALGAQVNLVSNEGIEFSIQMQTSVWEKSYEKSYNQDVDSIPEMSKNLALGKSDRQIKTDYVSALLDQDRLSEAVNCLCTIPDAPDWLIIDCIAACLKDRDSFDTKILNSLLALPMSHDFSIVSGLRNRLSFPSALQVLNHLNNAEPPLEDWIVVSWMILLFDAHFQQYRLNRDPQTQEILLKAHNRVTDMLNEMKEVQNLFSIISAMQSSHVPFNSKATNMYVHYTVDKITLY